VRGEAHCWQENLKEAKLGPMRSLGEYSAGGVKEKGGGKRCLLGMGGRKRNVGAFHVQHPDGGGKGNKSTTYKLRKRDMIGRIGPRRTGICAKAAITIMHVKREGGGRIGKDAIKRCVAAGRKRPGDNIFGFVSPGKVSRGDAWQRSKRIRKARKSRLSYAPAGRRGRGEDRRQSHFETRRGKGRKPEKRGAQGPWHWEGGEEKTTAC